MNAHLELLGDVVVLAMDAPSCRECAVTLRQMDCTSPPFVFDVLSVSVIWGNGYAEIGSEYISLFVGAATKANLADSVEALAEQKISEEYFPHIHMDYCHLERSETVSDFVIERWEWKSHYGKV